MNDVPLILLCSCFDTLDDTLAPQRLRQTLAERWPSARVETARALCKDADLDRLAEAAAQSSGVLAAACSGMARGREILSGLARRGVSAPMALADIREGCAWVHRASPDAAGDKAADLICMGLAGLAKRRGSPEPDDTPLPNVFVVGAGPAGLAAAGTLAALGVPVTLADRQEKPGGLVNQLGKLFPHDIPGRDFLAPLVAEVQAPGVTFLGKTTVTGLGGDPGRFIVRVKNAEGEREIPAGAVILACGALPVLPDGRYRSKELKGVLSQMELETRLARLESGAGPNLEPEAVVFIQCLAARDDDNPYCSTICCPTALKNALRLKALKPELRVTVLHRGIMTPGAALEEYYRRAMRTGVAFMAFDAANPPVPQGGDQVTGVAVRDALSGREHVLAAQMVVTSTPQRPHRTTEALARSLGVRLDDLGFACGVEPVKPLAPPVPGVFLCGAARWPVPATQAVDQGRAAGAQAAAFLRLDRLDPAGRPQAASAAVDPQACSRCGQCVAACPYGACRREDGQAPVVSRSRCRACGLCASVCPSGAAAIPERNARAVRAMLRQAQAPRIPA